jgi:hypothetical protein
MFGFFSGLGGGQVSVVSMWLDLDWAENDVNKWNSLQIDWYACLAPSSFGSKSILEVQFESI